MTRVNVQAGDTLYALLRRQGVQETQLAQAAQEVADANGLTSPNAIQVGQQLEIPPAVLGAGAASIGGASSVFGARIASSSGNIKGARVDNGVLYAQNKYGHEVELGQLGGAGSRGNFWLSPDNNSLIFSRNTGGGFENEGQSVFLFDGTKTKTLMGPTDGVDIVDSVKFVTDSQGTPLALVSEADGGAGYSNAHAINLDNGMVLGSMPGAVGGLSPTVEGIDVVLKIYDPDTDVTTNDVVSLSDFYDTEHKLTPYMEGGELHIGGPGGVQNVGSLDGGSSRGDFWVSAQGDTVAFAKGTGGGYENENQTLFVFNGLTPVPVVGQDGNAAIFDRVDFVKANDGRQIMLAAASDSAVGDSTVYVVDPKQAELIASFKGSIEDIRHDNVDVHVIVGHFSEVDPPEVYGTTESVSLQDLLDSQSAE